jgi:uncharacterized protein YlxW (UPF0749 family)
MTPPQANEPRTSGGRRDDAMSLLWRVYDDALDPGYAATAARNPSARRKWSTAGRSVTLGVAVLAVSALGTAVVLQTQRGAPDADRTRTDLLHRVELATSETDALTSRVENLGAKAANLRSQALSGNTADEELSSRVSDLERTVGLEGVHGPGLEIELADGPPDIESEGGPDLARVLDQDLQLAVNGLYAAGAEAVSINGQRLTTLSAIRGAGDAVLVGYRPLSPPYVISAIGDPEEMAASFSGSAAASQLRTLSDTYGIVFNIKSSDNLELPGKSDLTLRFAQPGGTR